MTASVPSPVKTSGNLPALHSMVFPESVMDGLGMPPEDHTRKQVQMRAFATHLTKRFPKSLPRIFDGTFEHVKGFFFAVFKKQPVTTEEFVQGESQQQWFLHPSPSVEFYEIYKKAQYIAAIRYLKRSLCCLISRFSLLSCTIRTLQQQIFLLI